MKKIIFLILVLALLFIVLSSNKNKNDSVENISLEEALTIAIEDEYKARETYLSVLEKFGEVRPFSNILLAEENHISSLETLFNKYEITVPENNFKGTIEVADTLKEMCEIGVQAEIDNAKLYKEKLIPSVTEYSDVTLVFENLMSASENNHLKAFDNCN